MMKITNKWGTWSLIEDGNDLFVCYGSGVDKLDWKDILPVEEILGDKLDYWIKRLGVDINDIDDLQSVIQYIKEIFGGVGYDNAPTLG